MIKEAIEPFKIFDKPLTPVIPEVIKPPTLKEWMRLPYWLQIYIYLIVRWYTFKHDLWNFLQRV